MRRFYLSIIAILAATFAVTATYPAGYYDALAGKSKTELKKAAKAIVSDHTRLGYTDLPTYWEYTDVYPQLVDGCKRWWDMYSSNVYLILTTQTARQSFSANQMQREHSVPKSWWKKDNDVEYTPAYSDLWNLYPSDGPANNAKSNYPFGICAGNPSFNNGVTLVGTPSGTTGGGATKVFEPADEYKGDFARSTFYMATVYDDLPWVIDYMFKTEEWPTLQPWAVDMLLGWARMDPVSEKEIARNDAVYTQQGNRNPYIDFPSLAEYVWGMRTGDKFDPANPGDVPTGPGLISPAQGSSLSFGNVATGSSKMLEIAVKGSGLKDYLSVSMSGADASRFTPSALAINTADAATEEGYTLRLTFKPTEQRDYSATLTISEGGLSAPVKVAVSGSGADPAAISSPEAATILATAGKGFLHVSAPSVAGDVIIADVTGRIAAILPAGFMEADLPLSQGLYIIKASKSPRAIKVMVR